MRQIKLNAYGKINLSIDVIGKREDGYHNVLMVMHQINLHDSLKISLQKGSGHTIKITSNAKGLPTNENNIAWKAAALMKEKYPNKNTEDIIIDIQKRIPIAAGLAGGSADAAAILHGMNILWDCGLSLAKLMEIGIDLGADVPFCIMSQAAQNDALNIHSEKASTCALAEGIGEILTPLPSLKAFVVLSKPNISILTQEVYENLNLKKISKRPDTGNVVKGLFENNFTMVSDAMENVLEKVSIALNPEIEDEKRYLYQISQGEKTMMSGSGPTIFTIFPEKELAQFTFNRIDKQKPWVFLGETSFISS